MPDDALIRFVREVLGCGCPDEVLASIEVESKPLPSDTGAEITRMDVGGRLLVYLLPVGAADSVVPLIAPLLEAGVADRDVHGFNRFRLALAATEPAAIEALARAAIDSIALPDDRIHLHVIALDAVPEPSS